MGDTGRQRDTRPSGRRTHHPTKGNKKGYNGRQKETKGYKTLAKADTPSNQGKKGYNGRQRETRPSGRRTQHPTKGNKKRYNGRQRETRPSGRRTHHPTKGNKRYSGRQG